MLRLQNRQLYSLLSSSRLERMIDTEIIHPDTYSTLEMVRDLRTGIFSEANYIKNVAVFRRNLQKSLIARMAMLLNSKEVL